MTKYSLLSAFLTLLLGASGSGAQSPSSTSVAQAPTLDLAKLEAFVDGIAMTAMEDQKVPGATLAVVNREEILLLKGYGYADASTGERVDPEKHLFRIASITKTFTATAVMQLLERGQVSLDEDIRTYLGDIAVDDHLGKITIADLLTHSAGFEDRILGYYGAPPPGEGNTAKAKLEAIAQIQVRPPGEAISYSNYSFALLGEIVARVSGEDFADYVRNRILLPLGMTNSDLRLKTTQGESEKPWLAALQKREARSHVWRDGWYQAVSYPASRTTVHPEGSMSATAADMARYMQMHLNYGTREGVEILQSTTWDQMSQPLFSNSPLTGANAHGFWTDNYNGYNVLKHGGSINEFKSMLTLLPELGLGIFVSTNSDSGSALRKIPERVIAEFFPAAQNAAPAPPADFQERAGRYVGTFVNTRRNEKRFDKVIYAAAADRISVSATNSGYLVLTRGGEASRYVEVGEDTFASVDNGSIVQFGGATDEPANWLFRAGGSAYEKPHWSEQRSTLLVPLILALLTAAAVLLRSVWRLIRKADITPETGEKRLWLFLNLSAAAWLTSFSALAAAVMPYAGDIGTLYEPYPTAGIIRFAYSVYASTLISFAAALVCIQTLRTRQNPLGAMQVSACYAAAIFTLLPLSLYLWNFYSII
ncbi:MAG: serine hydrolase domain-containing protein [Pseudomonadota bacterium]